MPKINFLLVCDKAELVGEKQKLNIEGAFDSVFSKGYPAQHKSLSIVVNVEVSGLESGPHRESFKIVHNGQTLVEDGADLRTDKARHQFIHRVDNFVLPAEGKYDVEVYIDGEILGSTYFLAKKI